MIARALASRPRLLVMDGLLDGIPANELEVVWEEIKRVGAPSTIVVATQSPSLAMHCDQTLEIT